MRVQAHVMAENAYTMKTNVFVCKSRLWKCGSILRTSEAFCVGFETVAIESITGCEAGCL